jgi:hypothetical protein
MSILGEISGVVGCATTPTAVLATLAAGFSRAFTVTSEIARAALSANMPGAGCFFPVLGKVAGISGMPLLVHGRPPSS